MGNFLDFEESDVEFVNTMTTSHEFKVTWFYKLFWTENLIDAMETKIIFQYMSCWELMVSNRIFFYIALSSYDKFHIKRPINLQIHRPRYALEYNNIIEDSIVDNRYYKVLDTIYFEDSQSKWKTITYMNDEYKKTKKPYL